MSAAPSTAGGSLTENVGRVLQQDNNSNSPVLDLGPPAAQQEQQQQEGSTSEEAGTTASTDDVAPSPPRRVFRRESRYTPPGSPGGLDKEQSVKELYESARVSFDGKLQPKAGELVALEHPVRQGPSRMVMEQDWTVTAGAAAAAPAPAVAPAEEEEEEEEEPWRPPSPQPSPPRVRGIVHKLP
ncbi:unnamed protein product, partial [Ectocarpus fasciculatus]